MRATKAKGEGKRASIGVWKWSGSLTGSTERTTMGASDKAAIQPIAATIDM